MRSLYCYVSNQLLLFLFVAFFTLVSHPAIAAQQTQGQLKALDALVDSLNLGPETGYIGYQASLLLRTTRLQSLCNRLGQMRSPDEEFANYWAKLMLDYSFIPTELKQSPTFARKVAELQSAADVYREMSKASDQVRHHWDITGAEKIELIKKAAVPRRLRKVKRIIMSILKDMGYLHPIINPEWAPVYRVFAADLEYKSNIASTIRDREYQTLSKMRDAYWNTGKHPPALDVYHENLKRLDAERNSTLKLFLSSPPKPYLSTKIIESDDLLNAYSNSTIAYDEEVIRLFSSKEVKSNQSLGLMVNGVYSLRESVRRQKILLTSGRRHLAAKLLHEMAEMCVAANGWERSDDAIYQAIRYASMAEYLDPSNEAISRLLARSRSRLRELDPLVLTSVEFAAIGFNHAVGGDYENAFEAFDKGLEKYPLDDVLQSWHVVVSFAVSESKLAKRDYSEKHIIASRQNIEMIYMGLTDLAERAEEKNMLYAGLKHYSLALKALSEFRLSSSDKWVRKEQKYIRSKLFAIYRKLPLEPALPDSASRYAIEAEQYLEQGEGHLALESYDKALKVAPCWAEGYYNRALIYDIIGAIAGAVWEMEMYLELEPNGVYARKAKKNLQDWKRSIQEAVGRGSKVIEGAPWLLPPITPDREVR